LKKLIIVLFTVAIAGYTGYFLGFNKCIYEKIGIENSVTFENSNVTGKIDYPLIDIDFSIENEWIVINRTELFTEKESLGIIQNARDLRLNTENLRILTFPLGRGITPNGVIYIYRDGEIVKEVPYIEMHFESEVLKNMFQQKTKMEVEAIINSVLPPVI